MPMTKEPIEISSQRDYDDLEDLLPNFQGQGSGASLKGSAKDGESQGERSGASLAESGPEVGSNYNSYDDYKSLGAFFKRPRIGHMDEAMKAKKTMKTTGDTVNPPKNLDFGGVASDSDDDEEHLQKTFEDVIRSEDALQDALATTVELMAMIEERQAELMAMIE